MTDSQAQHPWAKFYNDRGLSRPPMAELARRRARAGSGSAADPRQNVKASPLSAELAAAVAAVSTPATSGSAVPFFTPQQKELAAREAKRLARWRLARLGLIAAALVVGLHFAVTRLFYRAPSEAAVAAHVSGLAETVLPLFSSWRQPLQADGVTITQADQIDAGHFRYVATVTLRLRKPLYVPAVTNGTANYRRLQEALQRAKSDDLGLKVFEDSETAETPEPPTLPQLLQRVHQADEIVLVRVPFVARRFGWRWRLDEPQLALRVANRVLQGDSLDRYAGSPYLIFGGPDTLAEIRRRTQLANNYVLAVAKEVQRRSNGEAVADARTKHPIADRMAAISLADMPAQAASDVANNSAMADRPALPADAGLANVEARPAIDPNAPAILLTPPTKYFSAPRGAGQ